MSASLSSETERVLATMFDTDSAVPDYRQITTCTEEYFAREGDSPLGMGWPNVADAVRRFDVMLDVIRDRGQPVRLLDFGCGTGHLYEHIQNQTDLNVDYHGIDLSEQFIRAAQKKFPDVQFTHADVLQADDALKHYDYAVVNGVFTSRCQMTYSQMLSFVQQVLRKLFARVSEGMAFNAMSKHVDWERRDLFHLPLDEIAAFCCSDLSRHFIIRNDYRLYEFTTYVYHNA